MEMEVSWHWRHDMLVSHCITKLAPRLNSPLQRFRPGVAICGPGRLSWRQSCRKTIASPALLRCVVSCRVVSCFSMALSLFDCVVCQNRKGRGSIMTAGLRGHTYCGRYTPRLYFFLGRLAGFTSTAIVLLRRRQVSSRQQTLLANEIWRQMTQ